MTQAMSHLPRALLLYAALGSILLIFLCSIVPVGAVHASAHPLRQNSAIVTPMTGIASALSTASSGISKPGAASTQGLTSTNALSEVVVSASGLTTVEVEPVIVRTNDDLSLTVRSLHAAQVLVTLSYPDGETVQRQGRTSAQGWLWMKIRVLYQPLDRSATAKLTVQVTKDAQVETVPVTLSVLRQATLTQSRLVVRPLAIHVGQSLSIIVRSLGNVQVHITVTDPSGQTVSADGFTDASGVYTTNIPVSYNPGKQRGVAMVVSAWLSYGGEQSLLRQIVPFRGR